MILFPKIDRMVCFLFMVSFLSSCAQENQENISGKYSFTKDNYRNMNQYFLLINEDGTFVFKNYWKSTSEVSSTGEEFGKGRWKYAGDKIMFTSNPDIDIDQNHRLNMNNTIAEITQTKSSGSTKRSIKFLDSEIFWLRDLRLFKETPPQ